MSNFTAQKPDRNTTLSQVINIRINDDVMLIIWIVYVGMRTPFFFKYLFGCAESQLQHVESSSLTRIQPGSLYWEHRVLATGPPGKSQEPHSNCGKNKQIPI